ncbi:undecaprenyl-phosphate glucose phosphotransferase [Flavobacterium restrictum]|uniref:Undecaprenyl-phosphate glucose phosphotransferase n=1 Tax=Flavobacterium restrictum TaxID=2594428 RepID=A0A553E599_9FLAO|nr:undecaprenyl-phosphate glucose phosphotransferase [Flavobacterium restrictum]TRX40121.1 undecaprenyl-phosphate glucose phosphotransferase [Flavobacterium restrictum]
MPLLKFLSSIGLSRYFKIGFLLGDIIILNVAFIASFILRYGNLERLNLQEVKTIYLLSNVLWIILLLYKDSYRIVRIEPFENVILRTLRLVTIHIVIIALFVLVLKYEQISRLRVSYFYGLFFLLLIISRWLVMGVLKCIRSKGYNFRNVIIVGANDAGENMRKILSKDLTYGYRFLGFFDNQVDPFAFISTPILGDLNAIENYIMNHSVDEMYIALHIDKIKTINELTLLCERHMIRIKFIPDFQQYTKSRKVEVNFYENTPVLMLRKEPLEITFNLITKKVFDFVFSLAVIIFLFPFLFPILIVLIKLSSSGPVFFVQKRSGRDNKSFKCIKFRTMRVNTDSDKVQATLGDSRITKIGAFMRKTNLDELPQFFNVLWGEMSVVGPRPHMIKHTEQYSELINNYLVRHYAKPGITGWAQINGFRGETKELIDMKNRVEYDIWYIENWSLLLDIKIIWKTVFNTFKGEKNAY